MKNCGRKECKNKDCDECFEIANNNWWKNFKKNNMKDTSKISNADYEISNAAKTLGVKPHIIHLAKFFVGNDRAKVYDWVETYKGSTIHIVVE